MTDAGKPATTPVAKIKRDWAGVAIAAPTVARNPVLFKLKVIRTAFVVVAIVSVVVGGAVSWIWWIVSGAAALIAILAFFSIAVIEALQWKAPEA